jgi:hypothetical protein
MRDDAALVVRRLSALRLDLVEALGAAPELECALARRHGRLAIVADARGEVEQHELHGFFLG